MMFFTSNTAKAMTEVHYSVWVHIGSCPGGGTWCVEEWTPVADPPVTGGLGTPTYTKMTACDGTVTETGEKPCGYTVIVSNDTLITMWDKILQESEQRPTVMLADICIENGVIPSNIRDSIITGGFGTTVTIKIMDFDLTEAFTVTLPVYASTDLITTSNSITINTNSPVLIQIIELNSGTTLSSFYEVLDTFTMSIDGFTSGCKYAVVVYQEISDVFVIINTHNFCKE
jgi:hypothetical protein